MVNRNVRGNIDLPLRGFADMLSPSYPKWVPGKFELTPEYGDSYIMFASFGKGGLEKLRALQPQGNSLNANSKHFNDQMDLFSRQEPRQLSLKKEDVVKKAERVYHPN
jgi:acyl-homoserine-lactone acylase